ncbi:MAG: MATE family efflux transporter [Acidimicrobiia bacterium]
MSRAEDRRLLALAVPALGALVAEPIYVLTDTAIVGRISTDALAGLSVASAVLLTAHSISVFLAYGTTAAVARRLGGGDERGAADQATQGLWLALALGVLLALVGAVAGPGLIEVLGGRGEVAEQAGTSLGISLFGLPAMLLSLAGVGYLRGLQDTRTPLWVALGTAIGNGVVEAVLIFGFDQGIGASALSTVAAQWAGAAVFAWRCLATARRHGVVLWPRGRALGRLLVVGSHLLVRTAALRGSLLVGVSVATRIGPAPVAAYEIGFQIWSLAALGLDALAIAAQSLVAHALGAGDADGARRTGQRALVLSVGAGAVLAVVLALLRHPLAAVFSDDATVVALAAESLLYVAVMQPVNGAAFALDGILIGAGDQRFLAWAMALAFAVYTPAAQVVRITGAGLGWLWAALGLFMVLRWLVLHARFRGDGWVVLGEQRR